MVIGKRQISLNALDEGSIFEIQTFEEILDQGGKVHKRSILIPLLTSGSRAVESVEFVRVSLNPQM